MRNIFLEKSYTKYGGETCPRPSSKKSKLNICLDQQPEILYSLFFVCLNRELPKHIETNLLMPYFYLIQSLFKKAKKVWN